MQRELNHAEI